jgi:hypothetical protein
MSKDFSQDVVIRSNRRRLALQAGLILAIGIGLGATLQAAGILSTSPLGKLGSRTGLPMVGLAVAGMAATVAVVVVRDAWNGSITLGRSGLSVRDGLGRYDLPYGNILDVKAVPLGGAVIAIRDLEAWLRSAGGDTGPRRRTAAVISAQYGGHVWFYEKHLSVGTQAFVQMVEHRLKANRNGDQPGCG